MGYSIDLIDREKSIDEKTVDKIIKKLPKRLLGHFGGSKEQWGWSLRTDLKLDENKNGIKYLSVSGSFGGSGEWALDMVVALQQLLQREGHKIEIFSTDFGFCNKKLYTWLGYSAKELKDEESF